MSVFIAGLVTGFVTAYVLAFIVAVALGFTERDDESVPPSNAIRSLD